MSYELKNQASGKEQWDIKTEEHPYSKPSEFPPRKELHNNRQRLKLRKDKKRKQKRLNFPLVRVWLILFLFLVGFVATSPLWMAK